VIKKISHIGIAVNNLEEAIDFYKKLGLEVDAIETVPSQKVRVAFITLGETRLELLEPTSEDSPVAKFIEKKGEGIHHLALATENLPEKLKETEAKGVRLIDQTPRPGAHNAQIAFLHPKSTHGVLLELCEEKH